MVVWNERSLITCQCVWSWVRHVGQRPRGSAGKGQHGIELRVAFGWASRIGGVQPARVGSRPKPPQNCCACGLPIHPQLSLTQPVCCCCDCRSSTSLRGCSRGQKSPATTPAWPTAAVRPTAASSQKQMEVQRGSRTVLQLSAAAASRSVSSCDEPLHSLFMLHHPALHSLPSHARVPCKAVHHLSIT